MPSTTLPVPSKGAIRALRNLALGTSCTVAFGAGLLTADRRRRIHAAREVRDNARKLKAIRQYHGAGGAAISDVLDAKMSEHEINSWRASKSHEVVVMGTGELQRYTPMYASGGSRNDASTKKLKGSEENDSRKSLRRQEILHKTPRLRKEFKPFHKVPLRQSAAETAEPQIATRQAIGALVEFPRPEEAPTSVYNRQQTLARDVVELLRDGSEQSNIDAASTRFFEAFEEGISLDGGLDPELIEAALKLSQAFSRFEDHHATAKILSIIVSTGPIDEEVYFRFKPHETILHWYRSAMDPPSSHGRRRIALQKASKLYTVEFTNRSDIIDEKLPIKEMVFVGVKLCRQARIYFEPKYAELLFDKVMYYSKRHGDLALNRAVDSVIFAVHRNKEYRKVIKYSKQYIAYRRPVSEDFYTTSRCIGDALYEVHPSLKKEKLLIKLLTMADQQGFKVSTDVVLRLFRQDWENHHDIDLCRAYFDRLEPLLRVLVHPQQVYSALIQHCIEANDEPTAQLYYKRLRKAYPRTPLDVKIYGHFAHAKARRDDWSGVRKDFIFMKAMASKVGTEDQNWIKFQESYNNAFTPILRRFSESHSVCETENFLREFVAEFGITLGPHATGIMLQRYISEKELDSVFRWLDFTSSVNTPVSSNFLNIMLHACLTVWRFTFEEVLQVFQSVYDLGKEAQNFINTDTYALLRRFALQDTHNSTTSLQRLNHLERRTGDQFDKLALDRVSRMKVALQGGNPIKALDSYKYAVKNDGLLHPGALALAVEASLEVHPESLAETLPLFHDAESKGQDILRAKSALVFHQLNTATPKDNAHLMEIARNVAEAIDLGSNSTSTSPKYLASFVMSAMLRLKKFKDVVNFWEFVSAREGHPPISMDLVILTNLLQAYLGSRSARGVLWVSQKLHETRISPDLVFKQKLKDARSEQMEVENITEDSQHKSHFLRQVEDALEITLKLIAEGVEEKKMLKGRIVVLMEKAIGDRNVRSAQAVS